MIFKRLTNSEDKIYEKKADGALFKELSYI